MKGRELIRDTVWLLTVGEALAARLDTVAAQVTLESALDPHNRLEVLGVAHALPDQPGQPRERGELLRRHSDGGTGRL